MFASSRKQKSFSEIDFLFAGFVERAVTPTTRFASEFCPDGCSILTKSANDKLGKFFTANAECNTAVGRQFLGYRAENVVPNNKLSGNERGAVLDINVEVKQIHKVPVDQCCHTQRIMHPEVRVLSRYTTTDIQYFFLLRPNLPAYDKPLLRLVYHNP